MAKGRFVPKKTTNKLVRRGKLVKKKRVVPLKTRGSRYA